MAQKSKTARSSSRRSKLKKNKTFRPVRFSNRYWTGVLFIILFAGLGVYLLIRSFAASSFVLLSTDFDSANSVNASVITEINNSSKKNNKVVQLTSGASSKATFTSTFSESESGIYKVCMNALVVSGSSSGNFSVTPKPSGQRAEVNYTLAAASDYTRNICIRGVGFTMANMGAQATITNTGGGVIHIGSIIITKTGEFPQPPPTGLYISPSGSDSNPGTVDRPWRTFTASLPKLRPGDVLYARGGTYHEIAKLTGGLTPGTANSRITVANYPGEKPLIQGMFWLAYASYWTVDGINVTWDTNNPAEHMVQIYGGTDWILENSEISNQGAGHPISKGGLLIGDGQKNNLGNYTIRNNCIHDNETNVYLDDHSASPNPNGLIERNIIFNSYDGRGIKLGPPGDTGGPKNVVIRYNTIYDSSNHNISLSQQATNNSINRNILVRAGEANLFGYQLRGTGNVASDNLGYAAPQLIGNTAGYTGLKDGGGNISLNPDFDNISCSGFHPQNMTAKTYGKYAN